MFLKVKMSAVKKKQQVYKKDKKWDWLTLLMRYPAHVADQSENLLPLLLRYTGFFTLDQFTSFWLLLYLQINSEVIEKRVEQESKEIIWIVNIELKRVEEGMTDFHLLDLVSWILCINTCCWGEVPVFLVSVQGVSSTDGDLMSRYDPRDIREWRAAPTVHINAYNTDKIRKRRKRLTD